MSVIAPFFSERAKRRRAALRQLRRELPSGGFAGFVLRFPLDDIAETEYRDPLLLSADRTGIRIQTLDRSKVELDAPWIDISPIVVEYAPSTELLPVMVFAIYPDAGSGAGAGAGDGIEPHRYLGAHSSGTFGMSLSQVQRMARTIKRRRPKSAISVEQS